MDRSWHPALAIMVARKDQGLSQLKLAKRMNTVLGWQWDQGKISRIEGRKRPITWDEIEAFAKVQERPITWYTHGPNVSISTIPGYLKDPDREAA